MNNPKNHYDVVIVGGGMVGAAMALGLAQKGWQVGLLEHQPTPTFDATQPPDLRVSAISYRSVQLLTRLGAWSAVEKMRAAPYRQLETWEWQSAHVVFDAQSLDLPELGYMVENSVLQLALWQQLAQQKTLSIICPVKLQSMCKHGQIWHLQLDNQQTLQTPLVIGADGANSQVRQLAGIGVSGWQYRQSCTLISVKVLAPNKVGDATWQQFLPSGPKAFLPLFDDWACLVWYDSSERIQQLQAMTNQQLEQAIMQSFPTRLGAVSVQGKASFPLVRRHAQHYFKSGVVLLGDAAHTINPLAGQGVNLGYRDVESLLDVLTSAKENDEDWASDNVLARYQRWRRPDNLLMQNGMDLFYNTFSNSLPPLKLVRNLALMAAQRSGPLKKWALKYALGL